MQDPAAGVFVATIDAAELDKSWQLILVDGTRLTAGSAGVELLTTIDSTRWLGRTLAALRLYWLVGFVYWVVSNSRSLLAHISTEEPGPRRLP